MNKKLVWGVVLLLNLCLFAFSSCSDDDDEKLSKPVIEIEELGSGHDSPNDKIAYIGEHFHVSAEITADGLIRDIKIGIYQKDGEYKIEKHYTDAKYIDTKNTHFHEHLDVPSDAPVGEYKFVLSVTDKQGNSAETNVVLELMDFGAVAPEPETQEFEGVKLVVTYVDSKTVELRELFSDRKDVLSASSVNSKVAQYVRYNVSNVALYSDTHLDFIDTGLELHGGHFHTWDPAVRTSAEASKPTEAYWRVMNAVSFAEGSGDLIYTNTERVMEQFPPKRIQAISKPHKGIAAYLGGQYFAVTDAVSDNEVPSIIKIVKSDNTIVKEYTGYGRVYDRANIEMDYVNQAVYATDKGLLLLKIGYSTNLLPEDETISYPASFNGKPFDQLHNVKDLTKSSVLGIKKDEGIFNVDIKSKQIEKLLSVKDIEQVSFDSEEKFCYILTTEGILTLYNTNDFVKVASVGLTVMKNGNPPRIVATRKFVYVAYPGDSSILRFSATDLKQYKSIAATGNVSDIGLAGNLGELEINNHGQR